MSLASMTTAQRGGLYVPTFSLDLNLDSAGLISGSQGAMWIGVGNMITVNMVIDLDPTAAGIVNFRASLPTPSVLANSSDLSGVLGTAGPQGVTGGTVVGSVANNEAFCVFTAIDGAATNGSLSFMYRLLP